MMKERDAQLNSEAKTKAKGFIEGWELLYLALSGQEV